MTKRGMLDILNHQHCNVTLKGETFIGSFSKNFIQQIESKTQKLISTQRKFLFIHKCIFNKFPMEFNASSLLDRTLLRSRQGFSSAFPWGRF